MTVERALDRSFCGVGGRVEPVQRRVHPVERPADQALAGVELPDVGRPDQHQKPIGDGYDQQAGEHHGGEGEDDVEENGHLALRTSGVLVTCREMSTARRKTAARGGGRVHFGPVNDRTLQWAW
jgi:hypothetical protein